MKKMLMKTDIICRPANSTDLLKLSILFKTVYIQLYGTEGVSDEFANFITPRFSAEWLQQLIDEHPESIIVADNSGKLVGAAEIAFNANSPVGNIKSAELSKLYVLERFCGQGIGLMLLESAEEMLRKRGEQQYWLWVLDSNTRAINFYYKHGFTYLGNAPFQMEVNCYDNKVMLKQL